MRLVLPKVPGLLALALPVLVACNGTPDSSAPDGASASAATVESSPQPAAPEPQITGPQTAQQPAANQRAPQIDGLGLTSFDVVRASDGEVVGSFTRTGPDTWEGPHPATGEPAVFSSDATPARVVLSTDGPPILTLIVYLDTNTVSAAAFDEPHRLARAIYR